MEFANGKSRRHLLLEGEYEGIVAKVTVRYHTRQRSKEERGNTVLYAASCARHASTSLNTNDAGPKWSVPGNKNPDCNDAGPKWSVPGNKNPDWEHSLLRHNYF